MAACRGQAQSGLSLYLCRLTAGVAEKVTHRHQKGTRPATMIIPAKSPENLVGRHWLAAQCQSIDQIADCLDVLDVVCGERQTEFCLQ